MSPMQTRSRSSLNLGTTPTVKELGLLKSRASIHVKACKGAAQGARGRTAGANSSAPASDTHDRVSMSSSTESIASSSCHAMSHDIRRAGMGDIELAPDKAIEAQLGYNDNMPTQEGFDTFPCIRSLLQKSDHRMGVSFCQSSNGIHEASLQISTQEWWSEEMCSTPRAMEFCIPSNHDQLVCPPAPRKRKAPALTTRRPSSPLQLNILPQLIDNFFQALEQPSFQ